MVGGKQKKNMMTHEDGMISKLHDQGIHGREPHKHCPTHPMTAQGVVQHTGTDYGRPETTTINTTLPNRG